MAAFPGPIKTRNAAILHLAHECIRSVEDRISHRDSNLKALTRKCLASAIASNFLEERHGPGESASGLSLQSLIGIRDLAFFRYRTEIYDDHEEDDGTISSDDDEDIVLGYARVPNMKTLALMFERQVRAFNKEVCANMPLHMVLA